MANNYYSGQGSLLVATRTVAGAPQGFLAVGNVPELTIDIETSIFEHKESESGSRLTDLTIIKEKKGKFNFKLENLSLDNLALGLWGTKASVTGSTVTDEVVTVAAAGLDQKYALAHPGVTSVVVKDDVAGAPGTTTYVVDTDYTVDAVNGAITPLSTGAITAAEVLHVAYTFASYTQMDAFMSSAAPERWLRFEGLNTVDDSKVVIDIFKAQFDPLTGYGLLNEDLASVDMKGTILADPLRTSGSKFFRQRNF
jgi:hypothetical protein